ncbi:FAD-dependent monooxygenase [Nocardia arthritidis]|uniref:FAD-dependent oxidoreductase n=1 Tax=Nocardia arthritidis TaxID=228602 RepID=A0A6G9YIM3_9NOCA|nr:FAD-dependent monooxygenase [Nocardia arthritidis]QIS13010.1 FAD-dependent oxidoreductase [Nocardia arthritidis]
MNETFDAVVVGAGPVGLTLACELGLAGVDVLVVERLAEPDMTLKAGAINVPTAQALYRRGLLPELLAAQQVSVEGLRTFALSGKPISPSFDRGLVDGPGVKRRPIIGHFAGIMLSGDGIDPDDPAFAEVGPAGEAFLITQQQMEAILGRRAADLGIPVWRGAELSDFTDEGDGVSIRLGDKVIHAGWLIGCDGGRSTVRKLAGFEFPGLDGEITGHQAIADVANTDGLRIGWQSTPNGIYVYGPTPGRFLTVELDGPPTDRDAPITREELEASLRRVSGVPVEISAVKSATRFTDNTRQAPEYRKGRVLLAGDAAHVHSPFGGQGLNLGVGDAVNLGWKLAAVIAGRVSEELLDTYTAERHPIGAWVLEWTRAQVALMRLDPRTRALRGVMSDLIGTTDGTTFIFKKISGVLHRYDLGGGHPLIGAAAPDLELSDGTRLGEHFGDGGGVLLDMSAATEVKSIAAQWSDRVRVVTAKPVLPRPTTAMLVRPDGYVAWAADDASTAGLADALTRWFGEPA